MANDVNVVVLIGRLTRDCELKYTTNGTAIGRLSIAVNRLKRSGDQREEEVSYFDVTVWGRQAETLSPYLLKGRQVCINGELRQSRWEQDGQSRSRVEVVAFNIQLLGGGSGGGAQRGDSYSAPRTTQNDERGSAGSPTPMDSFPGPEQFDDDIPF